MTPQNIIIISNMPTETTHYQKKLLPKIVTGVGVLFSKKNEVHNCKTSLLVLLLESKT